MPSAGFAGTRKALGQSARHWLNLQAEYDLKRAEQLMRKRLKAGTAPEPV